MQDFDGLLHKDVKYVFCPFFVRFYSLLELYISNEETQKESWILIIIIWLCFQTSTQLNTTFLMITTFLKSPLPTAKSGSKGSPLKCSFRAIGRRITPKLSPTSLPSSTSPILFFPFSKLKRSLARNPFPNWARSFWTSPTVSNRFHCANKRLRSGCSSPFQFASRLLSKKSSPRCTPMSASPSRATFSKEPCSSLPSIKAMSLRSATASSKLAKISSNPPSSEPKPIFATLILPPVHPHSSISTAYARQTALTAAHRIAFENWEIAW